MSEQELNRKLAEWAGWTIEGDDVLIVHTEYPPNQTCRGYEAEFLCRVEQLNFTQSLDACFKWLVPKVGRDCDIYVSRHWEREGFDCAIHNIQKRGFKPIFTQADTPALALCLAIEKLIDAG